MSVVPDRGKPTTKIGASVDAAAAVGGAPCAASFSALIALSMRHGNYALVPVGSSGAPLDPSTLEAMPDGVLVAGSDARVEALNTAGAQILRLSAPDAVGRDYREVLPLADAQG